MTRRKRTSSYHEVLGARGFLERNAAGERICVWCGGELTGKRRKWCGDGCVEQYSVAAGNVQVIKSLLLKRDGGVCVSCGVDCEKQKRALRAALAASKRTHRRDGWWREVQSAQSEIRAAFGVDPHRMTTWDADHIIPIAEGGDNTLENFQTLCQRCHKAKTAQQAADAALRRRNGTQVALGW